MNELMQELVFTRHNRLAWTQSAAPTLSGPLQALVRPIAAARCDGDCLFLCHSYSRALSLGVTLHVVDPQVNDFGNPPFAGPFAYGHECVAEVVALGEHVRHVSVGQRVIVPFSISCGTCSNCQLGLTAHCQSRSTAAAAAYGFGGRSGGFGGAVSDLMRVPFADAMLVPVPEGVSPIDVASASDNLSDAWRTVGPHLQERPGAAVLVQGGAAQSIGLYAAGIAVALGASEVDYVDWDQTRLRIAEKLGARALPIRKPNTFGRKPLSLAKRYPITVDASSKAWGLEQCLRSLDNGGVCTGVGYYVRTGTPLPLWHLYLKGARFHIGLTNARACIPHVLKLVQSGALKPGLVTTHLCTWDDALRVLPDRTAVKVVLARPDVLREYGKLNDQRQEERRGERPN